MPRRQRQLMEGQNKRQRRYSKTARYKRPVTNRMIIGRTLGFPPIMKFKHAYSETASFVVSNVGLSHLQWRANGMYDPDITFTGHQPMFYDNMAAIYNHWVVIGSKIKVKIVPTTNINDPATFVLWNNDDGIVQQTNINAILESRPNDNILMPGDDASVGVLTTNFSAKKSYGASVIANANLRGTTSSDPSEQKVYTLTGTSYSSSTAQEYKIQVDIEYIATWFEPRDQRLN